MAEESPVRAESRQRRLLERLLERIEDRPWFVAAILVGSLAKDVDDALSDIDLLVVVSDFSQAWADRRLLVGSAAVASWDAKGDARVGAHKWLTRELVLVECLLGEVGTFRLAEPFRLLAGDPRVLQELPRRPTLTRDEVRQGGPMHPIERAYDEFKEAVRAERDAR